MLVIYFDRLNEICHSIYFLLSPLECSSSQFDSGQNDLKDEDKCDYPG